MPKSTENGKEPASRKLLPTRRLCETRRVIYRASDGSERRIFVSVGYAADEPERPREVFYDSGYRSGSELEFSCRDVCIFLSMLLQYVSDPQEITKSLSVVPRPDGSVAPASVVGAIVEQLCVPPAWAHEGV